MKSEPQRNSRQRESIVELTAIGNALLCCAEEKATDDSDKIDL